MKIVEITFQTICNAAKHQIRYFSITVLLFLLLGIGAGFIYAGQFETIGAGKADELKSVDFAKETYDEEYYKNCSNALQNGCANVKEYLDIVSKEKTMTETQRELISDYRKQAAAFDKKTCQPLTSELNQTGALYVPSGQIDTLIIKYEELLQRAKQHVDKTETFSSLFRLRVRYYENLLEQLREYPDVLANESKQMENSLEDARKELNELLNAVNQSMEEIAEKNHLNIYVSYGDDEKIQVVVNHTHSASSSEEAFIIILLLCAMVGICLGLFISVYREGKISAKMREGKRIQ